MKKIVYIAQIAAAVLAVVSCEIDCGEAPDSDLEDYTQALYNNSAADMVSIMSELIDIDEYLHYDGVEIPQKWSSYVTNISVEGNNINYRGHCTIERNADNSIFDEGAVWTIASAYIEFALQSDSTWTVSYLSDDSSYKYECFPNLEYSGVISIQAVSDNEREWAVSVAGSTSEDSGYSSEFHTEDGYMVKEIFSGYGEYERKGSFVADFYKNGEKFQTCTYN